MSFETIDAITLDDLHGLVGVAAEDKWREFKRIAPAREREDNAEFVADVTAFANAEGGYIFYGIAENSETHLASAVLGLPAADVANEQTRMENVLRDQVRPRLPLYRLRAVDVGDEKSVLVLWVGRSHLAPHQNAYNWQVFIRNSAGKNAMEISELADMITRRESLPSRIRQYRQNRVNLIRSTPEEMPNPVAREKKLVVHYIPEESFGRYDVVDVGQFNNPAFRGNIIVPPLRNPLGISYRANIDGFMYMNGIAEAANQWYVQFFNDATVEVVSGLTLALSIDNQFHPGWIEVDLFQSFRFVREAYSKLNLNGRVSILVSLLGMRDAEIRLPGHLQRLMFTGHHSSIGRDPALFNEVTVTNTVVNEADAMRPIIQQLWRACGYGSAASYNAEGEYIGYS
jgi:hypothetical protein